MRADARRNQERILDAAREQITESGTDVPMEQIARAAGVAVGTLYRHYPTKTDLVQAILREHVEELILDAEEAARSVTAPGDAMARIVQLLTDFMASMATNRAIKAAAAALNAAHLAADQLDRGRGALRKLVLAAQSDGDIRPEVGPDDVYLIMISAPTNLAERDRDRWLEICLAGISSR